MEIFQFDSFSNSFNKYIIESVHRQFRKLTKTKGAFPNDDSLLKQLLWE